MRRKIAEAFNIPAFYVCPLCDYIGEEKEDIVEHLTRKHLENLESIMERIGLEI